MKFLRSKNYIIRKLINGVQNAYYLALYFYIRWNIKFNLKSLIHRNWYSNWINKYEVDNFEYNNKVIDQFEVRPLISIILPVYNVEKKYLIECLESVVNQTYPYWELCIADDHSTYSFIPEILNEYADKDPRIKVIFRETNGHISECSNTAIKMATGDYIAFLDNDDLLSPFALYEVAKLINEKNDAEILFSDEDKLINGERKTPFFKKKWSYKLLCYMNYMCHLTIYKTEVIRELGGLRVGYEGVQDWDLALRARGKYKKVYHIPKILYHWRVIEGSTAGGEGRKNYIRSQKKKIFTEYLNNL